MSLHLRFIFGPFTYLTYQNWYRQSHLIWPYPKNPFVCPKEGMTPLHSYYFRMGLGTPNPIRSGGVWILRVTLQGINISHIGKRKIIFKMPFLGDMLVPWRVRYEYLLGILLQAREPAVSARTFCSTLTTQRRTPSFGRQRPQAYQTPRAKR